MWNVEDIRKLLLQVQHDNFYSDAETSKLVGINTLTFRQLMHGDVDKDFRGATKRKVIKFLTDRGMYVINK